jgi:hypothetical protein
MSASIPPLPPVPPAASAQRDQIVASAKSLPDLVAKAEAFDPAMAAKLKGQAVVASATPAGALVGAAIGVLVSKYGLGWDADTVNLISGLTLLAGGYVTHWVQARITSIMPKKA